MDSKQIGKFIAQLRKEKGLSQQQLADELGITNKAVSKWETGLGMPDISMLPALAALLHVSVDELLQGEKNKCGEEVSVSLIDRIDRLEQTQEQKNEKETARSESSIVMADYLVRKSIRNFRMAASLSLMFSLMGVIVPYFIWQETKDYTGILFGLWFECISGGIFTAFYIGMKHEVVSFRRISMEPLNEKAIQRPFLQVELLVWSILPIVLVISVLFDVFSLQLFGIRILLSIITIAIVYLLLSRSFLHRDGREG